MEPSINYIERNNSFMKLQLNIEKPSSLNSKKANFTQPSILCRSSSLQEEKVNLFTKILNLRTLKTKKPKKEFQEVKEILFHSKKVDSKQMRQVFVALITSTAAFSSLSYLCENNFNSENLEFLRDYFEWKNSHQKEIEKRNEIITKYINEGAAKEINISAGLRKNIKILNNEKQKPELDEVEELLDSSSVEIMNLLWENVLLNIINTPRELKKLLKRLH